MTEVDNPDDCAALADVKYFDYGMAVTHSMPCAVTSTDRAVLDLHEGVFQPSWVAQEAGWALVKERDTPLAATLRWLFGRFLYDYHP